MENSTETKFDVSKDQKIKEVSNSLITKKNKIMYIIQNIITNELEIATSLKSVILFTGIPQNKLHYSFSRKKETFFEYLEYKIYKKQPLKI